MSKEPLAARSSLVYRDRYRIETRRKEPGMQSTVSQADLVLLEDLNRGYIRAVQAGDVEWFAEHLSDDFRCSNPDGTLVDRDGFLAQTARPVTISGLQAGEVEIRLLGDIAIIHATTSYRLADGAAGRGRYTDVWARRDGRWLAISAHVTRN
jgi:ketosteroid isomerase-like protein